MKQESYLLNCNIWCVPQNEIFWLDDQLLASQKSVELFIDDVSKTKSQ
jgi:hypothetical protein